MKELKKSILILAGLPGVGKTTLVEELSKSFDVVSLSTDLIRKEVLKEKKPTIGGTGLVYEELIKMVEKYSGSESSIVVIDTSSLPKYDVKNESLLIGVTEIAKKFSRKLLKVALIANPETIIERLYKRAARDIDVESQEAYLKRYFEIDTNFSRSLPMGSNWSFIETTGKDISEVSSEAFKIIINGDNLNSKLYKEINSVRAQMYSDLFDNKILEGWITAGTNKENNHNSNGLITVYKTIQKIIECPDKESPISKAFFSFVNMPLKDNCFFLPEWGTSLRNTTAFCLKVIGRNEEAKEISPWLMCTPNVVRVFEGSLNSSEIILGEARLYVIEFPDEMAKKSLRVYLFTMVSGGMEKLYCLYFPLEESQNIKLQSGLELSLGVFEITFLVI